MTANPKPLEPELKSSETAPASNEIDHSIGDALDDTPAAKNVKKTEIPDEEAKDRNGTSDMKKFKAAELADDEVKGKAVLKKMSKRFAIYRKMQGKMKKKLFELLLKRSGKNPQKIMKKHCGMHWRQNLKILRKARILRLWRSSLLDFEMRGSRRRNLPS